MKESISITTILQIVILFILLFTAIMALTINNSNAFGMKDEIINIIELNKGKVFDENGNLIEEIVDAFASASYRTSGTCDEDWQGYTRSGEPTSSGAAVCIRVVEATKGLNDYLLSELGDTIVSEDLMSGKYYQVKVFYQLDIPVLNQVYNFSTKGETKIIYNLK